MVKDQHPVLYQNAHLLITKRSRGSWTVAVPNQVLDVEPIEDLQAIQPEEQRSEPKTPTAEEPEYQEPQ